MLGGGVDSAGRETGSESLFVDREGDKGFGEAGGRVEGVQSGGGSVDFGGGTLMNRIEAVIFVNPSRPPVSSAGTSLGAGNADEGRWSVDFGGGSP